MLTYRWKPRQIERPNLVGQLQAELNNLPTALARALVLRGINTFDQARLFFRPSLAHLHDPFLMKDMDRAVARLVQAIERGERVLVYGDYDVDGTTSTALMTHFLRSQGVDVRFFIPNRFKDGYGLGAAGIGFACEECVDLIVALDCGITAHEAAEEIRQRGIDLIICDHHTVAETIPNAVAVLDPKRPDCPYPFKELCGCGVGFKLVQAVLQHQGKDPEAAYVYLDLVAIATASDIVPVYDENRVLMTEGMARLRRLPRLGLKKLAQFARLSLNDCSSSQIVFGIGPRINAAGRLGEATLAVQLMLSEDPNEADHLAQQLEQANQKRKVLDRETLNMAHSKAERQINARQRHTVVLHDPDWHLGVIGIVASRIVERFHRPTIMMTTVNGKAKGSARSINGVNVYNALTACNDLLTDFGGHDYAAGMTMPVENVPEFQERFDAVVGETMTAEMMKPVINVDAELNLDAIDKRFWAVLKQFAPYGPNNRTPVFHARDLAISGHPRTLGREGNHLKFQVKQANNNASMAREVIGFNMHHYLPVLQASQRDGAPLEMVFSVQENTWRGKTSLQLRVKDLRLEGRGDGV